MATEILRVRVEPKLRRQLQRIADEEQRSLSNLIRVALTEYIASQPRREAA